jgi:hypothetical protein
LSVAYQAAWARNDFPAIWRYSMRIALIAKGKPWNDRMEVISSYQLQLDHRIIEPGDPLTVTLLPLFTLGRAARCSCRARLTFQGHELASESLANFPTITRQVPTASLRDGDYAVEYSLGYFTYARVFTVRRARIDRPPSDYLKRHFWYDTVNFDPAALSLAIQFAGADHLLAGSDYPHQIGSIPLMLESIRALRIPDADRAKILGDTAAALFAV